MNTSLHLSLTNLFKTIREEKLEQFSVLVEDKVNGDVDKSTGKSVRVWCLSRPFISVIKGSE